MYEQNFLPLEDLPTRVKTTIFTGERSIRRLAELGLTGKEVEESLMAGHNGAQLATAAHARIAAGTYRWHECLAHLRNALLNQGWVLKDEKNAPRVVSPNGNIAIMVATGNEKTGTKSTPSNATPKGVMTEKDIWNNRYSNEGMLEGFADITSELVPTTWVLLYFYSSVQNHIRAELSQPDPDGFQKGYITSWTERIILPSIDLGSEELLLDAQPESTTPDFDFLIGDAEAS